MESDIPLSDTTVPGDGRPLEIPQNVTQLPRGQELVDKWCIVRYDSTLYPGKILDVDDDDDSVLVQALHPIGENKFIIPTRKDETLYNYEDIVTFISEPVKPSDRSRYVAVDPTVWKSANE